MPLIDTTKTLKRLLPGIAIRETIADDGIMEEMLAADDCAIAIMSHPMTSDAVVCVPYMGETLHLSVPNGHLLASYDAIRFRDFNGYDIVVRPDVGFWMDVCRRHLPASRLSSRIRSCSISARPKPRMLMEECCTENGSAEKLSG